MTKKPFEWSGHCQIYKGHLGWNVEYGSEDMLAEDVSHYDAIEDANESLYEIFLMGKMFECKKFLINFVQPLWKIVQLFV